MMDELCVWLVDYFEEFWVFVVDDLGIEFDVLFIQIFDVLKGNEWVEWFVGGKFNFVDNCFGCYV